MDQPAQRKLRHVGNITIAKVTAQREHGGQPMSAFGGNVLQNYFEGVARAILIQDQTKMSNVDSPHRSIGFDYCAIAMRQRVLQHIQG